MKALPPSVFNEMTRRLVAEFQPEQVILFGSHAWGTPSEDSDVDVLVIVSASDLTPTERAARAYRCLRGVQVPKDILVKTRAEAERYRHVPASLEREIFEHGKVLYERRLRAWSQYARARAPGSRLRQGHVGWLLIITVKQTPIHSGGWI